jgi:hypothetical protein
MAGRGERDGAARGVVDAHQAGHEVVALERVGEGGEVGEDLGRVEALHRVAAQRGPHLPHDGCRVHSAAHDVTDRDRDPPAGQRDDVVPVAAHLRARRACEVTTGDVELGDPRQPGRQ